MKKVGILSIGDELMNGFIVDTNSSWISKKISNYESLEVSSKVTVCDSKKSIHEYLKYYISNKYDYIFITGGLGPTHDDITKRSIATYFDLELYTQKEYYLQLSEIFEDKYGKKDISYLESQAQILRGSEAISNKYGTALGMHLKVDKSNFYILPGVPKEMKSMLSSQILPNYFSCNYLLKKNIKTILTAGVYESKLSSILSLFISEKKSDYKFSFLPNYTGVKVRIQKLNSQISEQDFLSYIKNVVKKIKKYVYGFDDDTLQGHIVSLMKFKKQTLSIVESCSGGLISKMITDVPGSSCMFRGSVVAYNDNIKVDFIGVERKDINDNGAVSSEIALSMAKNIKNKFNSDFGISTTGISGPSGGTNDKPVGLVYIAVAYKDNESIVKKFNLLPDRDKHRKMTSHIALNMLRLLIVNKKTFDLK